MAGRWIELATLLLQLPRIHARFLAGGYSFHRASTIAHALTVLPAGPDRDRAQSIAIDLAARRVTDPALRDQLDALVIDLDPDLAEQVRAEFADHNQNLTITADAHGHATIDACVPADHAAHLRHQITTLLATRICRSDPRTTGQQRVAALAELLGTPGAHLHCTCTDLTCTRRSAPDTHAPDKATAPTPPELTPPAPQVVVLPTSTPDIETPAVVTAHARLRGHGSITPAHAAHLLTHPGFIAVHTPLHIPATTDSPPIDPIGHGGHAHPPPGALTYAPTAGPARTHPRHRPPTTDADTRSATHPPTSANSTTSCPSTTPARSQAAGPCPKTSHPCAHPTTTANTSATGHPP
ncbi:hypothetical protein GS4_01_00470 [Gordonia soli NBRC 108243]|uniref:Uncharacterized protein n=1 Tax=Gordonia soli NBRC 108243 TaxID=1223545 RepID=M0QD44_9ACTN|nr:DUF222 domain-containing protein [Gordonia soli]GAC66246.1 hypothetical protein GS4_01_00470 [Gordonia soli NBRC 108243]